ncbi:glycosyltransferase 87 family protein [Hymenobacter sp. AT01-02]|uniref:glycosyltransferase 87 family protein n=1 Tax=Hymenobacter sp. AT01-02 TaxID=1571877 RepID=UPI000B257A65|nr:glycosyltransferase 87 family protein [Hymenobacter sp. AT01-02]
MGPTPHYTTPANQPRPHSSMLCWLLVLLAVAAYGGLAYYTPRHHFGQLLGLMILAFGAYAGLWRARLSLRVGLAVALGVRLLWLPALPAFSDDYYRFRWDGLLVAHGLNPFQYRPDELLRPLSLPISPSDTAAQQSELSPTDLRPVLSVREELGELYSKLNSPHYYSVYPPVCQAVFGVAAWLFPSSALGFVVVLRLVVLAAEIATAVLLLALLRTLRLPTRLALLYLLNPLVVVELTGNLHFEAVVITFLLLMFWLLGRNRVGLAGGALGLAAAAKLLPLLVVPLLVRRLGWKQFIVFGSVAGGVLLLLFVPFLSAQLLSNIGRSLNLYFRNFEFNASVYYLLRPIGEWLTGWNQIARIGPALALTTAIGSLALAGLERVPSWRTLFTSALGLLTLYFLLATTVHPWYLTPLVALSIFTRFRYPLVWSGLAVLSYATYQTAAYTENLWLVALEYAGVGAMLLWELRRGSLTPTVRAV